jgi:polysaccharide pyruvyl transferase WcaK-like protein
VQLCCIPMSQHPFVARDNDLLLARRLRTRVPGLLVMEGVHHPAAVLSAVGSLTAMVAMRYHALRFAHRMGTPVLAILYAPKSRALAEERGLPTTRMEATAISMWLRGSLQGALPWTA